MKIRNGFVSNSSSTSFIIRTREMTEEEIDRERTDCERKEKERLERIGPIELAKPHLDFDGPFPWYEEGDYYEYLLDLKKAMHRCGKNEDEIKVIIEEAKMKNAPSLQRTKIDKGMENYLFWHYEDDEECVSAYFWSVMKKYFYCPSGPSWLYE